MSSRLQRWRQVVASGNESTFQKRLQWDGFDANTIRLYIDTCAIPESQSCPAWTETLRQMMQAAVAFSMQSDISPPTDPAEPLPFEDVLLPAIVTARANLLSRLRVLHFSAMTLPFTVLSENAYRSLERTLLRQLTGPCERTLDKEFSRFRPFGYRWLHHLVPGLDTGTSDTYYRNFTNHLLQEGLQPFFQTYPVLGRLMATAVNFWVEATATFLQRLHADRTVLAQFFVNQGVDGRQAEEPTAKFLGKVTDIQAALSDPHNRGQTVAALTFESGVKLIYKPKDLSLDVAFAHLLAWCNQHSDMVDFKEIRILNRQGYGWMEYIEQQEMWVETSEP